MKKGPYSMKEGPDLTKKGGPEMKMHDEKGPTNLATENNRKNCF